MDYQSQALADAALQTSTTVHCHVHGDQYQMQHVDKALLRR